MPESHRQSSISVYIQPDYESLDPTHCLPVLASLHAIHHDLVCRDFSVPVLAAS